MDTARKSRSEKLISAAGSLRDRNAAAGVNQPHSSHSSELPFALSLEHFGRYFCVTFPLLFAPQLDSTRRDGSLMSTFLIKPYRKVVLLGFIGEINVRSWELAACDLRAEPRILGVVYCERFRGGIARPRSVRGGPAIDAAATTNLGVVLGLR